MAVAFRVPTLTGSIIDLTVRVKNPASAEEVNKVFAEAADGDLKGVLKYETDPIVSSDIIGSPYSSIFGSALTTARDDFVRVVGWYDDGDGFANRLGKVTEMLASLEH